MYSILFLVVFVLLEYTCFSLIPIIFRKNTYVSKKTYLKRTEIDDDYIDTSEIDRAIREEGIMKQACRIPFVQISEVSAVKLVDELNLNGVTRINNVLNLEDTKLLLTCINEQLKLSIETVGTIYKENNEFAISKAQDNRWDLKLHLSDTIHEIMEIILLPGSLLGDTIYNLVGNDAYITELAAFVTINGASRQIIHSDTFWTKLPSLYTCTIAMQDVSELMGPTVFIPATHTEEIFLQRVTEYMEDDIDQDSQLLNLPHTLSMLDEGSAAIYDSRLLHCGGANRSKIPRVLFYFTISNPAMTRITDEEEAFNNNNEDNNIDKDNNNILKNDNKVLYEDPEGIFEDVKKIKASSSIRNENKGYKLSDFRKKNSNISIVL